MGSLTALYPRLLNCEHAVLLSDVLTQFLEYFRVIKGASEHTIRNYASDLAQLQDFAGQGISLPQLDRAAIRAFILARRSEGDSKRSMARKLSSFRSFFRYCLRKQLLEEDPTEFIDRPKLDRPVPRSLTYGQVERFFSLPDIATYLGIRDRAIMELFYSSGLRVSELVGLNRGDVDADELLMLVRGKGKKERLIPITEAAAKWLATYLQHPERPTPNPEAIFLNCRGSRLSVRSVDRLFARYFTLGGFAGMITPHIIRHTIATHWLEQGMDLKTIQILLGHASMATTTIYTEVSTEVKRRAVAQYHPRGDY